MRIHQNNELKLILNKRIQGRFWNLNKKFIEKLEHLHPKRKLFLLVNREIFLRQMSINLQNKGGNHLLHIWINCGNNRQNQRLVYKNYIMFKLFEKIYLIMIAGKIFKNLSIFHKMIKINEQKNVHLKLMFQTKFWITKEMWSISRKVKKRKKMPINKFNRKRKL